MNPKPSQIEDLRLPEMQDLWHKTLQWQPNREQQQNFQRLYQEILRGNRQLNLTRITEPQKFWEKHLWDSLMGVAALNPSEIALPLKAIDVGTGAGFPGIPLAITYPHWQITLLDSTRKKIAFVQNVSSQLKLTNVKTLVSRAETIGQQPARREQYDLALIRAVSHASACAEYILPLVKVGGIGILYRGNWSEVENSLLQSAVALLGGKIESIQLQQTPLTNSIRHCIYLRKIKPTARRYPRAVGIPNQKPLI